jgi:hypothetical protein
MPNLYHLLLQFHRPFWWYHLLFTAVALLLIIPFGLVVLPLCLVFKLSGYASAAFIRHHLNKYVYDYYRNAGQGIIKLYIITFTADLLAFLLVTSICLYLSPVYYA